MSGRVAFAVAMTAGAGIFAAGASEVGTSFWAIAALLAILALWCGSFSVLVTVSGGTLKVTAGGVRVLRVPAVDIDRVAPVVKIENEWGIRHLFGIYTVFDGRVQAIAGLPVVQIGAGGKSVATSVRDWVDLVDVLDDHGARLDGKERVGVRLHEV